MDKFEKLIKDAVEGYEAPYNPQAWENVSQGLNQTKPLKWIIGGTAAALVVAATVLAVNYSGEETVKNDEVNNSIELVAENSDNNEAGLLVNNDVIAEEVSNNIETNEESNGSSNSDAEPIAVNNNNNSSQNGSQQSNTSGNDGGSTTTSASTNQSNNSNGSSTAVNHVDSSDPMNVEDNTDAKTYNAEFTITQNTVCQNQNVICIVNQIDPELIYVWEFGDGSVASGHNVSHKYASAGDYKVTLSLKDKQTNKTLSKSSNLVEILEMPKVDFAWEKASKVIPTVKFINLTENAESFVWNIKGVQSSSQNEFEYTFRNQGIYSVSMTATNANGCTKTVEKSIAIEEDYNLLAPTAFTPNGDFINDDFIPEALKIMDAEFIMTIYDESGVMLYETRNVNEPWDGRMTQDNSPAPDGGYVWVVKVRNAQGEYDTYKGQVFITR